jgi:hypothetical protein
VVETPEAVRGQTLVVVLQVSPVAVNLVVVVDLVLAVQVASWVVCVA